MTEHTHTGWRGWLVGRGVNRRAARVAALVTAFVGAAVLVLDQFLPLAGLSYDLAYLVRGVANAPDDVAIVSMDRKSSDRLGQEWMGLWDRGLHARLIDFLAAAQARGVVFDVLFDQPARTPAEDEAFIKAVRAFGLVAVGGKVSAEAFQGAYLGPKTEGPFPALSEFVRWGLAPKTEADMAVRRASVGNPYKGSLAFEAAQMIGATNATAPDAACWMNYYGPSRHMRWISYADVISNQVARANFKDRTVFVGATYDISYSGGRPPGADDHPVPYTRWTGQRMAGVEVAATAFLNCARNEWLRRASPWLELAIVLGAGLVGGFSACRFRPLPALLIGLVLVAVTTLAGLWLPWLTGYWFPWLIPAGVQSLCAAGCSLLGYTQLFRPGETAAASAPPPAVAASSAPTVLDPTPAPASPSAPMIPDHQLLREIGRGAYGEVWLARDAIGSHHAVKIVYRRSFPDAGPYEREFRGLRNFTPISRLHPGLLQVLHVGRNDDAGYFYCVMEVGDDMASGQTVVPAAYSPRSLEKVLKQQGRMRVAAVAALGRQLAEALAFLHRQDLGHRDVKPSNILYVRGQPKLADVGLVTHLAQAGGQVSLLGTRGYLPPEGPGTAAADVYALGKVLYVAATGRSVHQFPELPDELGDEEQQRAFFALNRVLLRACADDPAQRYPSATDLVQALDGLGANEPTPTAADTPATHVPPSTSEAL